MWVLGFLREQSYAECSCIPKEESRVSPTVCVGLSCYTTEGCYSAVLLTFKAFSIGITYTQSDLFIYVFFSQPEDISVIAFRNAVRREKAPFFRPVRLKLGPQFLWAFIDESKCIDYNAVQGRIYCTLFYENVAIKHTHNNNQLMKISPERKFNLAYGFADSLTTILGKSIVDTQIWYLPRTLCCEYQYV